MSDPMNPCDPVQQQAVQDRLEALYEADGRHDPDHPMHCLYCGLAQAASTDEPAVPIPPADGEVAELVAWLQEEADDYECIGCEDSAAKCKRAAELLQRPVADLSPTAYALLTLAAELES